MAEDKSLGWAIYSPHNPGILNSSGELIKRKTQDNSVDSSGEIYFGEVTKKIYSGTCKARYVVNGGTNREFIFDGPATAHDEKEKVEVWKTDLGLFSRTVS